MARLHMPTNTWQIWRKSHMGTYGSNITRYNTDKKDKHHQLTYQQNVPNSLRRKSSTEQQTNMKQHHQIEGTTKLTWPTSACPLKPDQHDVNHIWEHIQTAPFAPTTPTTDNPTKRAITAKTSEVPHGNTQKSTNATKERQPPMNH